MHETSRDARIWNAGYLIGFRHAEESRTNLLANRYPDSVIGEVIDLREWRLLRSRPVDLRDATGRA